MPSDPNGFDLVRLREGIRLAADSNKLGGRVYEISEQIATKEKAVAGFGKRDQAFQFVIAVRAAADDPQREIDLGGCLFDQSGSHAHACLTRDGLTNAS